VTIVYPSWWEGGRWDVEELLDDVFTFTSNKAADGLSGLKVEPFMTSTSDREKHLADGGGYLLVHRVGGHFVRGQRNDVDESIMQLGGLTASRHESNNLMSYVTDVLNGYEDGGTVFRSPKYVHPSGLSTTFMKVPGEVVGPQLVPASFQDERMCPAMWNIHVDRPRGLPDTREALGLIND
jgi:hypothetical protein